MPPLVSQAVSQSVNNIYWVPNESSAMRQRRGVGSGLEGRQDNGSQRKGGGHDPRMPEKQHLGQGHWKMGTSHLLSTCNRAAHTKGLFGSELDGPPNNPVGEAVFTSPSLSFLSCKMSSNEMPRSGGTGVCAAGLSAAACGHCHGLGRAPEQGNAAAAVPDPRLLRAITKMLGRARELLF